MQIVKLKMSVLC